VKQLDNALNYACQYTKFSQELVEYIIGTFPKEFTERDNKADASKDVIFHTAFMGDMLGAVSSLLIPSSSQNPLNSFERNSPPLEEERDLNLPHTSGIDTFTDDDHMRILSDSDDDVPKDGVFSTNSFDDENTDNEEDGAPDYNNMDSTIDVTSTPTLRIHKIHPQSQIIGKSTAGILTRRKLKESASDQHQALLSFIYKQNSSFWHLHLSWALLSIR
ncbi:hypothetical protein Tco_1535098, partial [Tanacetum coccineum]